MDYDTQRAIAAKLARAAGATKTLASIENPDCCFDEILRTAREEIGLDAFAAEVLRNDPTWAYNAILYVSDLGDHLEALLKRANDSPEPSLPLSTEDIPKGNPVASVHGFDLKNNGGFDCSYTMRFKHDGTIYPIPIGSYSPIPYYARWTSKMQSGQSDTKDCTFFNVGGNIEHPGAIVSKGDLVWIYVKVSQGNPNESAVWFTYDPDSEDVPDYRITGTTYNNTLAYEGSKVWQQQAA